MTKKIKQFIVKSSVLCEEISSIWTEWFGLHYKLYVQIDDMTMINKGAYINPYTLKDVYIEFL